MNWTHLAGLGGTIVCHAGATQIGAIVTSAADARPPARGVGRARLRRDDAAAADGGSARWATSSSARAEDRPALLVVGAVVGLREHLRWFDARPLFGRRIVVTRSREQAGALADALEEQGAEAIALPTIRILPPSDPAPLDEAVRSRGDVRLDRLHERQRGASLHAPLPRRGATSAI